MKARLVTAATSCVQNVIRCAERCGLVVADVVLTLPTGELVGNPARYSELLGPF